MELQKYLYLMLLIFVFGCEKDDEKVEVETEKIVNGRIVFSKNNNIPELLKIASFSGKTVLGSEDIQQPNDLHGFEFILDENDEIIFLSRKYPNYADNDISSKSTALFLATLNSTFRKLSVDQKVEVIEQIVSNQNFVKAVEILDSQENISIQNTDFLNKLALTTREVFSNLVVSRNSSQFDLPVTSSEFNGNNVKIKNISPFHVGIDVYKGSLLVQNELLDSDEELSYDLESENTEYTFVVRSGFLPLGQTITEAALNAFEADYISLLDETIGIVLANAVDGNCLVDTLSTIYSNVSFVAFYEDNNGNALNTFIDILTYVGDNFLDVVDSSCFNIDMGNFSEIFDFFSDLSFLQSVNEYYEAAYVFPLYALYENNENICYTYVNNEIFVCEDSPVSPVFNPTPSNNSTDVPLSGQLTFTPSTNTPNDATYKIFFGSSSNPTNFNISSSPNNTYSGTEEGTTYYWKVETLNNDNSVLATSPVWNFTTLTSSNSTPTLTTNSTNNVTETSATSGGNITNDGGSNVTARGVCWSTSPNPDVNDNTTNSGSGTGNFSSSIVGLNTNTTYYVKAYATNSEGTNYGNELNFTTTSNNNTTPTLTTNSISSITEISASSGGNITSDGGSNVTARGVCWSTNPNPDINDNTSNNGTGTGNFSSTISGLITNTTYYVKAYATNSEGTNYGNELNFTTTSNSGQPNIIVTNQFEIDDDTSGGSDGNNNGIPEAGEEIELSVQLQNTGTATATNVTAVLSTNDSEINITDANETYGTITVGSTDWNTDFDFNIDVNCPTKTVDFILDITSDQGSWQQSFSLNVEGSGGGNPQVDVGNNTPRDNCSDTGSSNNYKLDLNTVYYKQNWNIDNIIGYSSDGNRGMWYRFETTNSGSYNIGVSFNGNAGFQLFSSCTSSSPIITSNSSSGNAETAQVNLNGNTEYFIRFYDINDINPVNFVITIENN
ncbi:hypothetical protein [Lacinutrix himadriensis]|uniref:hypothetical protein n=1 Tax=Lacinutrix himadriensis TaxID=641549 RepID=UPI0006E3BF59|nr:hypothetical protein [Lacinutrix himadriensis]